MPLCPWPTKLGFLTPAWVKVDKYHQVDHFSGTQNYPVDTMQPEITSLKMLAFYYIIKDRKKVALSHVQLLWSHELWPARLLCSWDSPGKNTRVGCHFLLQGNFPTQELNPSLPHCRQMLYQLSYRGSPLHHCWLLFNHTKILPYLSETEMLLPKIYTHISIHVSISRFHYHMHFQILFTEDSSLCRFHRTDTLPSFLIPEFQSLGP